MSDYADSEVVIRRLERALLEQRLEKKRAEDWTNRDMEVYQVLDRVMQSAKVVARRVAFDHNEEVAERGESHLTPEVLAAADRTFRRVLDLTPPGKTALATFRPMWPMSLAQLEAQVLAAAEEPRTNPAPLFRKDAIPKSPNQSYVFGIHRAMQYSQEPLFLRGTDFPRSDLDALEGVAWNLSMPEGFPPYPRRGGVYGAAEARSIADWLVEQWPVSLEVLALARQRDKEILRAGVPPQRVQELLGGESSLVRWLTQHTYAAGRWGLPSAENRSPKDFLAAVLEWARERLLPSYHALQEITPSLFQRHTDPDEHVRTFAENYILRGSLRPLAERVYGLSSYGSSWLEKLAGDTRYGRRPADFIASDMTADTVVKRFLLSTLLDAQAREDAAYAARRRAEEAAAKRGAEVARAALRPMLAAGKAFTRTNVQAALPEGYVLEVREVIRGRNTDVYLRNTEARIASGSGSNITAALTRLRSSLGLE